MGKGRYYVLDDEGNPTPASYELWLEWIDFPRDLHVADDRVGELRVSTVFLGVDHGIGPAPMIYETMIFIDDDMSDIYMERYSTREEAIEGHKRALVIAAEYKGGGE